MEIKLSNKEKARLEERHKTERDKRIADRIKAVLLTAKGWSQTDIAEALLIRHETVHDHLRDYIEEKKLKPENGGSTSHLTEAQSQELIEHLENQTYVGVLGICRYVRKSYKVKYTVSGMTKWLHTHKFSYKKPKTIPAKADPAKQAAFIEYYENLKKTTPQNEPILFGDGVHPTMATKVSYGWIRTGKDKPIATIASRTRVNIMGALNLRTMQLTAQAYETIDSAAMCQHFALIKETYPQAAKIHIILDQGPYNISAETAEGADKYGIVLHHLPTYSPNLNPIERVWKVMSERVRNNVVFKTAKEFRTAIDTFFAVTWPKIALSMKRRINDKFQRLDWASSS